MRQTPREAAEAAVADSSQPSPRGARGDTPFAPPGGSGDDERLIGYGVMGLPFASGHYLAFRCWPHSSIGPGYRAVWHRDPEGTWTFYATEPPDRSCARYLSAATTAEPVTSAIDASWTGPGSLHVTVAGGVLSWDIEVTASAATRVMTASASAMPAAAWDSRLIMGAMGHVAGPVLRAGRVKLAGQMANGQAFLAAPLRVWAVPASRAVLHGADLGPVGPLARQARLGDFWMPQRGIFAAGRSRFEAHDPARHHPLPGGTGGYSVGPPGRQLLASPGGSVADQAVVGREQAG
jgi:hypothetical protein